jgi:hypothetical protein
MTALLPSAAWDPQEVAKDLLARGYSASRIEDISFDSEVERLVGAASSIWGVIASIPFPPAEDCSPEAIEGFQAAAYGDPAFVYRKGSLFLEQQASKGLTPAQRATWLSFVQRQKALFSSVGSLVLRTLCGMGCCSSGLEAPGPAAYGIATAQASLGLEAGSGGGFEHAASMSSLTIQRHIQHGTTSPSSRQSEPNESQDCTLLTAILVPAGAKGVLRVFDRERLDHVEPTADLPGRFALVMLTGHLYDVAFGARDGLLATPHVLDLQASASTVPAIPAAGSGSAADPVS